MSDPKELGKNRYSDAIWVARFWLSSFAAAHLGIRKADGHSQVANLLCRDDLAASVATLPVYQ
jgi:hypothetical protein